MMSVPHDISQTSDLATGVISRRNRRLLSGYFIGPKGYAEQRIKKWEIGIAVQITLSGRGHMKRPEQPCKTNFREIIDELRTP